MANSFANIAASGNAGATRNRRDCNSTCSVAANSWRGTNQPPRPSSEEFFPEVTNRARTYSQSAGVIAPLANILRG